MGRFSAKARYEWHRRSGLDPLQALNAVAIDMGLQPNVVRLAGKSPDEMVSLCWTLDQMDDLMFLRHDALAGHIGSKTDGAKRYPEFVGD